MVTKARGEWADGQAGEGVGRQRGSRQARLPGWTGATADGEDGIECGCELSLRSCSSGSEAQDGDTVASCSWHECWHASSWCRRRAVLCMAALGWMTARQ